MPEIQIQLKALLVCRSHHPVEPGPIVLARSWMGEVPAGGIPDPHAACLHQ